MFAVIAAPVQVIVASCKAIVTFVNGVNHLAEAFESTTSVANNAASTWAKEEAAINAAKLSDLEKRIAEAKEKGIQFKRKEEEEIPL